MKFARFALAVLLAFVMLASLLVLKIVERSVLVLERTLGVTWRDEALDETGRARVPEHLAVAGHSPNTFRN